MGTLPKNSVGLAEARRKHQPNGGGAMTVPQGRRVMAPAFHTKCSVVVFLERRDAPKLRIGTIAHQSGPEHSVELCRRYLIGSGKVEAGGDRVPISSIVFRTDPWPLGVSHVETFVDHDVRA